MKAIHRLRETRAEINLDALGHNLSEVRRIIGTDRKILAVVKANGYGHGAVSIAKEALLSGADSLGVAIVEEGIQLRRADIKAPILVLSGIFENQIEDVLNYDLTQVVYTFPLVKALSYKANKLNKIAKVHVKVDTGMGRMGVALDEAVKFVQEVRRVKNIEIEGILTHFAAADAADRSFTNWQFENFKTIIEELENMGIDIPIKHIANSAAIIDYPDCLLDMVRPGIMLYGSYPSAEISKTVHLNPVMTLKTKINLIKEVPAGTNISYGSTFTTKKRSRIATLPIGYDDGFSRLLSNKGEVLVRGRRAPVVGRVCMDMCMIDVTHIPEAEIGDEVVLIGQQGTEKILAEEIASKMGTISYEVFCLIGERVPRLYIKNNQIVNVCSMIDNEKI